MRDFLDKILTIEDQTTVAEYSRKAKKELSSLPLISALGDTVQGASGLSDMQKKLKSNPKSPKYWLFYYEANIIYRKINNGVNLGRVLINPIGFIAGRGISTSLNSLDDEFEKFDSKKCLGMIMALSMLKVKNQDETISSEDIVILSKALAYSAESIYDKTQKNRMLLDAIEYISIAIKKEKNRDRQGEYFFYLSQFYKFAQNEKKMFRALNISRKLGFKPADIELRARLKEKILDSSERSLLDQFESQTSYSDFTLTYSPHFESRLENSWEFVKEEQLRKFKDTGRRVSKFLEKNF